MSKIKMIAARKEWRCSKCGKTIVKGEQYYILRRNYHGTERRCAECGFRDWERSSSWYIRSIGQFKDCMLHDFPDGLSINIILVVQCLERILDDLESNYESMPEGINEGPTGQILQERIETVQDVLDQLEELEEEGDNVDTTEVKSIISQL